MQTDLYENTKNENRISYFWDELIQRTCQNSLDGTLGGNSDILLGESAIYEMVKEPRFMRRGLAEKMLSAVERFPDTGPFSRQVTFLPSFEPNVAYVLLQLRAPDAFRAAPDYREKRRALLEIACGSAKNKFPHLVKVIGIGIDAPKFSGGTVAEDFVLTPCETWTERDEGPLRRAEQGVELLRHARDAAIQRYGDGVCAATANWHAANVWQSWSQRSLPLRLGQEVQEVPWVEKRQVADGWRTTAAVLTTFALNQ